MMVAGVDGVFRQTALHLALAGGHVDVIAAVLESSGGKTNLNLKNSTGQTVLGLALLNDMESVAAQLITCEQNLSVLKPMPLSIKLFLLSCVFSSENLGLKTSGSGFMLQAWDFLGRRAY
jgi:hypothetical protein